MRCRAWAATVASGTVLLTVTVMFPAGGAVAAPSPVPVPSPSPGTAVCTVDKNLGGITGLTLEGTGYAVTVHAADTVKRVYLLSSACKLSGRSWAYNPGANDPQDIEAGPDGSYWVADTGDNVTNPQRSTVAVWKFTGEGRSTLYRFTYPDRPQSAQAMLLNGDGNPVIITVNTNGPAGIYVPAAALDPAGKAVKLKHVGDFTPQDTGTENKLGKIGTSQVTGAANSHDGKKVAIRTYADAYEWDVTNGDVVGALTTGTPKITPMPNEPAGSALAYTTDNASFLTVSDLGAGQAQILKYKASPAAPTAKGTAKAPAITTKGDTRSWFAKLNLQDLLRIVGAVGVLGLLMVVGGIVGIRRARRRPPRGNGPVSLADEDGPDQPVVAMAQMPVGPPDRYDNDRYESAGRYPVVDDRQPPAGQVYGRPAEPEPYGPPPRRNGGPPAVPPRGGIARSHRPGNRRSRDREVDPTRRGYSDQHDGFRDMLE